MAFFSKDPRTKSDLIDRILSQVFTGDLRDLAADPEKVEVSRPKPHVISIKIGDQEFLLAAHKPKPEKARIAAKKRWEATYGPVLAKVKKAIPKKTPTALPPGEARGGAGRYASTPKRGRR